MNSKINIIYSLAEDNLTASEVERLISELETLQEIKERQESECSGYAPTTAQWIVVMQSRHVAI